METCAVPACLNLVSKDENEPIPVCGSCPNICNSCKEKGYKLCRGISDGKVRVYLFGDW